MKLRVTTEHEIRVLEHVNMVVIDSDDEKDEDLEITTKDDKLVITAKESVTGTRGFRLTTPDRERSTNE